MKKVEKITFSIGIVITVVAMAWIIYSGISIWDQPLTLKLRFVTFWKPTLLICIGYLVTVKSFK